MLVVLTAAAAWRTAGSSSLPALATGPSSSKHAPYFCKLIPPYISLLLLLLLFLLLLLLC
jgi:hypothetical protein